LQELYLSNLFFLLGFLQDNGVPMNFGTKDVYNGYLDLAVIHDDQSEILKLVVIGLYQFISVQQKQFKAWVDKQKDKHSHRSIEELVKQHISKPIFEREIDIIESK
jgi:hypothetical protein